jgi:hypothetical protein
MRYAGWPACLLGLEVMLREGNSFSFAPRPSSSRRLSSSLSRSNNEQACGSYFGLGKTSLCTRTTTHPTKLFAETSEPKEENEAPETEMPPILQPNMPWSATSGVREISSGSQSKLQNMADPVESTRPAVSNADDILGRASQAPASMTTNIVTPNGKTADAVRKEGILKPVPWTASTSNLNDIIRDGPRASMKPNGQNGEEVSYSYISQSSGNEQGEAPSTGATSNHDIIVPALEGMNPDRPMIFASSRSAAQAKTEAVPMEDHPAPIARDTQPLEDNTPEKSMIFANRRTADEAKFEAVEMAPGAPADFRTRTVEGMDPNKQLIFASPRSAAEAKSKVPEHMSPDQKTEMSNPDEPLILGANPSAGDEPPVEMAVMQSAQKILEPNSNAQKGEMSNPDKPLIFGASLGSLSGDAVMELRPTKKETEPSHPEPSQLQPEGQQSQIPTPDSTAPSILSKAKSSTGGQPDNVSDPNKPLIFSGPSMVDDSQRIITNEAKPTNPVPRQPAQVSNPDGPLIFSGPSMVSDHGITRTSTQAREHPVNVSNPDRPLIFSGPSMVESDTTENQSKFQASANTQPQEPLANVSNPDKPLIFSGPSMVESDTKENQATFQASANTQARELTANVSNPDKPLIFSGPTMAVDQSTEVPVQASVKPAETTKIPDQVISNPDLPLIFTGPASEVAKRDFRSGEAGPSKANPHKPAMLGGADTNKPLSFGTVEEITTSKAAPVVEQASVPPPAKETAPPVKAETHKPVMLGGVDTDKPLTFSKPDSKPEVSDSDPIQVVKKSSSEASTKTGISASNPDFPMIFGSPSQRVPGKPNETYNRIVSQEAKASWGLDTKDVLDPLRSPGLDWTPEPISEATIAPVIDTKDVIDTLPSPGQLGERQPSDNMMNPDKSMIFNNQRSAAKEKFAAVEQSSVPPPAEQTFQTVKAETHKPVMLGGVDTDKPLTFSKADSKPEVSDSDPIQVVKKSSAEPSTKPGVKASNPDLPMIFGSPSQRVPGKPKPAFAVGSGGVDTNDVLDPLRSPGLVLPPEPISEATIAPVIDTKDVIDTLPSPGQLGERQPSDNMMNPDKSMIFDSPRSAAKEKFAVVEQSSVPPPAEQTFQTVKAETHKPVMLGGVDTDKPLTFSKADSKPEVSDSDPIQVVKKSSAEPSTKPGVKASNPDLPMIFASASQRVPGKPNETYNRIVSQEAKDWEQAFAAANGGVDTNDVLDPLRSPGLVLPPEPISEATITPVIDTKDVIDTLPSPGQLGERQPSDNMMNPDKSMIFDNPRLDTNDVLDPLRPPGLDLPPEPITEATITPVIDTKDVIDTLPSPGQLGERQTSDNMMNPDKSMIFDNPRSAAKEKFEAVGMTPSSPDITAPDTAANTQKGVVPGTPGPDTPVRPQPVEGMDPNKQLIFASPSSADEAKSEVPPYANPLQPVLDKDDVFDPLRSPGLGASPIEGMNPNKQLIFASPDSADEAKTKIPGSADLLKPVLDKNDILDSLPSPGLEVPPEPLSEATTTPVIDTKDVLDPIPSPGQGMRPDSTTDASTKPVLDTDDVLQPLRSPGLVEASETPYKPTIDLNDVSKPLFPGHQVVKSPKKSVVQETPKKAKGKTVAAPRAKAKPEEPLKLQGLGDAYSRVTRPAKPTIGEGSNNDVIELKGMVEPIGPPSLAGAGQAKNVVTKNTSPSAREVGKKIAPPSLAGAGQAKNFVTKNTSPSAREGGKKSDASSLAAESRSSEGNEKMKAETPKREPKAEPAKIEEEIAAEKARLLQAEASQNETKKKRKNRRNKNKK